jgi:Flp pilus assembly protein TadG
VLCLVTLVLICSLAMDFGRVAVAKAELQGAADSAARYAASGMVRSANPSGTATLHANAIMAESKVDGQFLSSSSATVEVGTWNDQTKIFQATNQTNLINAVRVTLNRDIGGTGTRSLLAQVAGRTGPVRIRASSIVQASRVSQEFQPPASGNLWLSGMPDNTTTNNHRPTAKNVWDNNGTSSNKKQRPLEIDLTQLGLAPGMQIAFEGVSGGSNFANTADGNTGWVVALGNSKPGNNNGASMNGLSNTRAPIGAIMAVFLGSDAPNTTAAPSNLDFAAPAQRDFATIAPATKQVFFVGDGKRSNGEVQYITIPTGATRLSVGMMDAWQWNDNSGNFKSNLYAGSGAVVTVR